jgi:hypothetical protein
MRFRKLNEYNYLIGFKQHQLSRRMDLPAEENDEEPDEYDIKSLLNHF